MFFEINTLTFEYITREIDKKRHWWKEIFSAKYKTNKVLQQLDLQIEKSQITSLLGKNGSGKTTLIKILCGILTPTFGKVEVLGYNPHKRNKKFLRQIGVIFGQKKMLWPELTLEENFKITGAIYQVPPETVKRRSEELIENFELKDILSRPVKTFSLGQSMRAELANILLYQPIALFLDEPTIGMDIQSQKYFRKMIKQYVSENKCHVLLTSHNLKDVIELSDEILFLENGKVQKLEGSLIGQIDLEQKIELRLIS